jgi:hypothetical protein
MFGRVRYAKEASVVLVRLDCRSGFNVGGLECLIITERTHGPRALGCLIDALFLDCREEWCSDGIDGIRTMLPSLTICSACE